MSKDNLHLPKTSFSMKASLPTKEPLILEKWEKNKIFEKLRKGIQSCLSPIFSELYASHSFFTFDIGPVSWIPYDEETAIRLEEEYAAGIATGRGSVSIDSMGSTEPINFERKVLELINFTERIKRISIF